MPNGNSILVQAAKDKMIHLVHKITINCPRYHEELNTENEHALHYIATWRRCPCTNKNCTTNKNILQTIDALSAYVNEKDTKWCTPLMLAQDPTVILRLLLNNAHVNTQDKDGNTPIMYAIKRSNPVSVKLLEGALFLKNIQGENHVDIQKTIYAQLQTSLTEVAGTPHVYDAFKYAKENAATINDLLQHKQTEKTRSIQKETRKKMTNQLNLKPRDILSRQLGMRPKKLRPHNNNNTK